MSASSNNTKAAWKASRNKELTRLCSDNKTSDWKLPGGIILARRTRGIELSSSHSRSNSNSSSSNPDDEDGTGEDGDTDEEDETTPSPPRALLEVNGLEALICRAAKCGECKGPVEVEFPTCCIASYCRLVCANSKCEWQDDSGKPARTDFPLPDDAGSVLIERTTDYAVNVLYVLSHLASGDGGREAERHLTFLGLPNSTTMERSSFTAIEERISPSIRELNKNILKENLFMEVEAVMRMDDNNFDETAFEAWKQAINDDSIDMANAILPEVVVAADMGWQKRSSGRRYDSNSGHAILVGKETRLPIALCLKSKICRKCDTGKPHQVCFKNHNGSSKAMEPLAILDMVVALHDEHHVITKVIIADDDSSMKAKLKYSNADHLEVFGEYPTVVNKNGEEKRRPNKGCLPKHLQQPIFLADPNHRKKTLKNALYTLEGKKVKERLTMTRCDVIRIGKNFAFMARTLPFREEDEYVNCGKAVLEHHFDNHEFCGEWCLL